jgi:hypothetical protein
VKLGIYSFGFCKDFQPVTELKISPPAIIRKSPEANNSVRQKMSLEAKIRSEIEVLRALEEKAFGPRHGKYDFYVYLEAVWKLYLKWKEARRTQARAKRLAAMYKFKLRKNTHPIRAIIDASSTKEVGDKSEWTRALKYAERKRSQVEKVGFKKFLESNGGPAGCADMGAAPRVSKKRKVRSNWGRRRSP